ncbi:RWP-RK domain [Phytophthora infestans]|uniref:RWP-RK domain n=1 Tax=Phytophthora infestans TaxID=4787 RepID=A0A833W479_PHYIN|nr:RWP-RK domain [Phytophthora infestans]
MSLRRAPWPLQDASGRAESSSDSDQDEAAFSDATHDYLEQEEAAPSDSEAEDTTHIRKRRQRIHFDVAQLQTVYHLPLKTAAERLGICEAALKRICRRNHISKWPYRQLSSVRRRIAELKDRRAVMLAGDSDARSPEQRDFQDQPDSVTPVQFDDRLRRLEEEQNQIIMSAHQSYRPRRSELTSSALPPPFRGETLMVHLHGFQSSTAGLPPLDLNRLDRDFPLLFLANVCESVRAYNA